MYIKIHISIDICIYRYRYIFYLYLYIYIYISKYVQSRRDTIIENSWNSRSKMALGFLWDNLLNTIRKIGIIEAVLKPLHCVPKCYSSFPFKWSEEMLIEPKIIFLPLFDLVYDLKAAIDLFNGPWWMFPIIPFFFYLFQGQGPPDVSTI